MHQGLLGVSKVIDVPTTACSHSYVSWTRRDSGLNAAAILCLGTPYLVRHSTTAFAMSHTRVLGVSTHFLTHPCPFNSVSTAGPSLAVLGPLPRRPRTLRNPAPPRLGLPATYASIPVRRRADLPVCKHYSRSVPVSCLSVFGTSAPGARSKPAASRTEWKSTPSVTPLRPPRPRRAWHSSRRRPRPIWRSLTSVNDERFCPMGDAGGEEGRLRHRGRGGVPAS